MLSAIDARNRLSLLVVERVEELRQALSGGRAIAFVPTMGNLHAGHLSLVKMARERARGGLVVASVFVNPLQFAPHEDFAAYPRTLERDCEMLADAGCDLVFAPSPEVMYPDAQTCRVLPPAPLALVLEGEFRPGFFVGVATVVVKLFGMVRPTVAVFGRKDYQQWRVVEAVERQLALGIEIISGATVRELDGLAMSSRNGYLSAAERQEAVQLSVVLNEVAGKVRAGGSDWRAMEWCAVATLKLRGWSVDYVSIRRRADLADAGLGAELVVLGAARIGRTRLIDNVEI
jgi:pantoate--beta-alanine ligase